MRNIFYLPNKGYVYENDFNNGWRLIKEVTKKPRKHCKDGWAEINISRQRIDYVIIQIEAKSTFKNMNYLTSILLLRTIWFYSIK